MPAFVCVCVCVCVCERERWGGGGRVHIPCRATSDSFFIRLLAGLSSCYTILPLYWYSRNSFCKQSIIPHIKKKGGGEYFKTVLVFQVFVLISATNRTMYVTTKLFSFRTYMSHLPSEDQLALFRWQVIDLVEVKSKRDQIPKYLVKCNKVTGSGTSYSSVRTS